jgi:hypothetical protein
MIARAAGDGSARSRANPPGTPAPGWAIIRGIDGLRKGHGPSDATGRTPCKMAHAIAPREVDTIFGDSTGYQLPEWISRS